LLYNLLIKSRFNLYLISVITLFLLLNSCLKHDNTKLKNFEYKDLFNKKDLSNWKGDTPYWRVENGVLIGEITDSTIINANRFLIYQNELPSNFELIVEFKVSEFGNSGINYRSQIIEGIDYKALRGYQFDIDGQMQYTGSNYEEKRRSTLASIGELVTTLPISTKDSLKFKKYNKWEKRDISYVTDSIPKIKASFKKDNWNTAKIIARDNELSHYLNGVLMSKVIDNDSIHRKLSGQLGVQVHVGPPMTVSYKSIKIKKL